MVMGRKISTIGIFAIIFGIAATSYCSETYYEIWRGTTSAISDASRIEAWVQGTSFDDPNCTPGQDCYYRVKVVTAETKFSEQGSLSLCSYVRIYQWITCPTAAQRGKESPIKVRVAMTNISPATASGSLTCEIGEDDVFDDDTMDCWTEDTVTVDWGCIDEITWENTWTKDVTISDWEQSATAEVYLWSSYPHVTATGSCNLQDQTDNINVALRDYSDTAPSNLQTSNDDPDKVHLTWNPSSGNSNLSGAVIGRRPIIDTTPPNPDPMTWTTQPCATGPTSIRMVATTASDASGVEYYFDETSGYAGGTDSGWQDSPTYEDTGLQPDTTYTYKVKARDKSSNQNPTEWAAPKSATTSVWTQVTDSASWAPREHHTSVVYNGKIWIIGGVRYKLFGVEGVDEVLGFNDVWSSSDGVNWTQVTDSAPWPPRHGHSSVVYDGKIWVIGGIKETLNGNTHSYTEWTDVWCSSDGVNWTQVTDSAPNVWHKASSVVYDGKIWIIGGQHTKNDVWCSSDGVNWTQVTDSLPCNRGYHSSVVYDGKMWVIGGLDDAQDSTNDVWYSLHGLDWTQATDSAAWSPRFSHASVVFDGKVWVLGGSDLNDAWYNDAWYSADGSNWMQATDSAAWSARGGHTSVVHLSKMWIIGGGVGSFFSHSVKNDIWCTPVVLMITSDSDIVTIPEGGITTFQLKLSAQPSETVTVSVGRSGGDSDISVISGSTLTFTTSNWNIYQTVTLEAAEDADAENGQATIRCSAFGVSDRNVTARELDDHPQRETRQILSVSSGEYAIYPSYSPDGTKISYGMYSPSGGFEIWVMNSDGSGVPQKILDDAFPENWNQENYIFVFSTAWSPDGTKIAYTKGEGTPPSETLDIWTINSDGSGIPLQITTVGNAIMPSWSPDGKQIAYVGFVENQGSQIWLTNSDGTGSPEQITNGGFDFWPSWSPDGKQIAYTSYNTGSETHNLWVVNSHGMGEPVKIVADIFLPSLSVNYLFYTVTSWSPDGAKICYVSDGGIEENLEIWVTNADGTGTPQPITTNGGGYVLWPVWFPDSTKIVYASVPPGEDSCSLYVTDYLYGDDAFSVANIVSPILNQQISGIASVIGTVTDNISVDGTTILSSLSSWTLEYGEGEEPEAWTNIITSSTPKFNELLASWDTSALASGKYTLRLKATDEVHENVQSVTVQIGSGAEDYYDISGQVSLSGGTASVSDVLLTLNGADSQTTYPEASGNYNFAELDEGNYTVTPSLTGYHFFPDSLSYSPLVSAQISQDFAGLHETYDSEPDNLPDWWEQQIVDADPDDTITSVEDVLPGGDFDGDGFSNLLEYLAGTDPTDENSKPIIKGDINADGNVNLADAILTLKALVGISAEGIYPDRDVNGDGRIGLEEVIYILQKVAGLRLDSTTDPDNDGCYPDLPSPELIVTGTEDYEANGREWTRYLLSVTNRSIFPNELFEPAPDLPPCGLNSNASRTWVNIYNGETGAYIYGFCALSLPEDLDSIWFAVPRGEDPPPTIYIKLQDRRCNITYTSNLASTDVIPGSSECNDNCDCMPGLYCAKMKGDCGGQGHCSPRPEVCTEEYDPVCGCDGVTYGNACEAARAGVSVAYHGVCMQP